MLTVDIVNFFHCLTLFNLDGCLLFNSAFFCCHASRLHLEALVVLRAVYCNDDCRAVNNSWFCSTSLEIGREITCFVSSGMLSIYSITQSVTPGPPVMMVTGCNATDFGSFSRIPWVAPVCSAI